mgnify:CR=1 FL=1
MTRDDFILTKKANGDARTVEQIGAEHDALLASLAPPPDPAVLAAAVKRSDAVNEWLAAQVPGEGAPPERVTAWDALRCLPFDAQAKLAGL